MNDTTYALNKLVKAVKRWIKAKNVCPLNEKSYKELLNAERELTKAMSIAQDIVNGLVIPKDI